MTDRPPFLPGELVLLPMWMSGNSDRREVGLVVEAIPSGGRFWHVNVLASPEGARSEVSVYSFNFDPNSRVPGRRRLERLEAL
jgi:hypothetical protein